MKNLKILLLLLLLPFINIGEITAQTYTHDGGVKIKKTPTAVSTDLLLSIDARGQVTKSTIPVSSISGGLGDVTKVGTPVNNQLGIWTGDGTIEGDADLLFDGTGLSVTTDSDSYGLAVTKNGTGLGGGLYVTTGTTALDNAFVVEIPTGAQNVAATISVVDENSQALFVSGYSNFTYTGALTTPTNLASFTTSNASTTANTLGISNSGSGDALNISHSNGSGLALNVASGNVGFGAYGGGTITGTPTYYLAVDSSGNIIEDTQADINIIKEVKITLSAAQIKALGTTPITAIVAQGAGTLINVLSINYNFTYGTTPFDANSVEFNFNGAGDNISISDLTLNATADNFAFAQIINGHLNLVNTAVVITGTDSIATGDSTLDVYIAYSVITL